MTTIDDLRERIKRHEGTVLRNGRHRPYKDSVGKMTIGWGRNLEANGIRQDEAELMLSNDLFECAQLLRVKFPWTVDLDDARRSVLIEMLFNMGLRSFSRFVATLAAVEAHRYVDASERMLESLWARQVGDRARRLAAIMATGEFSQ